MRGESNKYQYLRSAKKGREGLCHQRTKTQAGHRALSEFAKKETLRIVPQQFLTIKRDTVQLTYPISCFLLSFLTIRLVGAATIHATYCR